MIHHNGEEKLKEWVNNSPKATENKKNELDGLIIFLKNQPCLIEEHNIRELLKDKPNFNEVFSMSSNSPHSVSSPSVFTPINANPKPIKINKVIEGGQLSIAQYYASTLKPENSIKYANKIYYKYNKNTQLWDILDGKLLKCHVAKFLQSAVKSAIGNVLIESTSDYNTKMIQMLGNMLVMVTKSHYVSGVVDYCSGEFQDEKFCATLNADKSLLVFKNGMLCLKTGTFRVRTQEDRCTFCLDWNYSADRNQDAEKKVKQTFLRISNDDEELLKFHLEWFAYCMTGETKETKFLLVVGHSAQNGKSTMFEIHSTVLKEYCAKLDKRTFNENYEKSHKQLIGTAHKRFVYLEELERKNLNGELVKEYVDGKGMAIEVLFGTTTELNITAKLNATTNHDPKFETDEGIKRRGYMSICTNRFLNKHDIPEPKPKGVYERDSNLTTLFQQEDYKNAYVNILLEYSKQYYSKGLTKCIQVDTNFKEACDNNDKMGSFLEENYEITNDTDDNVSKTEFMEKWQETYPRDKTEFKGLTSDLKRKGLVYDKKKMLKGKVGIVIGLKELPPAPKETTEQEEVIIS